MVPHENSGLLKYQHLIPFQVRQAEHMAHTTDAKVLHNTVSSSHAHGN
jgi:hypothetical protein